MSRSEYQVIARRYRPQSFDELVGQSHVAVALKNAISTGRIGHAYLFTGARGVGKTSTARILAKALNALGGPTVEPDLESDMARRIDAGEDIDVLEIDGASNRGIEEIRQLRANIHVRPSRCRFKIYIIDEVHMLTTPAFNALLKTLEEPPEHVKFILCTTDPEKVPVTVLSRCQRFDFAPVAVDEIVTRLRTIVEAEGMEADEEALELLARRAGGSMRDSQSLLEQLLAFVERRIEVTDIHGLLGTADHGRVRDLAHSLLDRDLPAALAHLDAAVVAGVDVGQLAEQLIGYFRDMMVTAVGGDAGLLRFVPGGEYGELRSRSEQTGTSQLLAILQILDDTVTRLRQSSDARVVLELALVRIGQLEDLWELRRLAERAGGEGSERGPARPAPEKKTRRAAAETEPAVKGPARSSSAATQTSRKEASDEPTRTAGPEIGQTEPRASGGLPEGSAERRRETTAPEAIADAPKETETASEGERSADQLWRSALSELEDITADLARCAHRVALSDPDCLVVGFRQRYTLQKESCEKTDRKTRIEEALSRAAGRPIRVDMTLEAEESGTKRTAPKSRRQRLREIERHPLVRRALEVFDADILRVEPPRRAEASTEAGPGTSGNGGEAEQAPGEVSSPPMDEVNRRLAEAEEAP